MGKYGVGQRHSPLDQTYCAAVRKITEPSENRRSLPNTACSSPRLPNPPEEQAEAKRLASLEKLEAEKLQYELNLVYEQDVRTLLRDTTGYYTPKKGQTF